MARYLIQSAHAPEECLRALDAILARGPDELARYDWGCIAGDHTGYAVVEAASKAGIEDAIPSFLRRTTRVVELSKFTPEEVSAFHHGL